MGNKSKKDIVRINKKGLNKKEKKIKIMIQAFIDNAMQNEVAAAVSEVLAKHSDSTKTSDMGIVKLNMGKLSNIKAVFNERLHILSVYNATKPHSAFNTPIKSLNETILAFWWTNGRVPFIWGDPFSEKFANRFSERVQEVDDMEYIDSNGIKHKILYAFKPVPFMENTKKELIARNYRVIINALKKGLARQGIRFKN